MFSLLLPLIFFKLLNAIQTGEWQLNDSKAKFVNYDKTNTWYELGDNGEIRFTFKSRILENNQLLLEDKNRIFLKIVDNVMYFSYDKDDIIKNDFNQVLYTGKWIISPIKSSKYFQKSKTMN